MKKLISALLLVITPLCHAAERLSKTMPQFDFQSVNTAQVIQLVYSEALTQPFVIDPVVLTDQRLVSFRFDAGKSDFKPFWRAFLDSLALQVETRNGVDFVLPKRQEDKIESKLDVYIYQPKYRDSSYLAELLGPLFRQGGFTINRTVKASTSNRSDQPAPTGSAAANIDQQSDLLVFQGSSGDIEKLEKLLSRIDIAVDQVMVKAAIYEVTYSKNEGSAFQLAANLLGSKFGISLGSSTSTLDSSVRFKNGTVDAVMSALAGDARFKIISSPQLRVKSGGTAKLTIGAEVPVLGGVSYQNNGTAVRSVEYRSSGVIFSLQPQIRQNRIELTVGQQISNFSKTETGVNDSPTLTKRELSTQIAAEDGEMILLGGLQESKDSGNTVGLSFFPKFMQSTSKSEMQTEVLMMLQLKKI